MINILNGIYKLTLGEPEVLTPIKLRRTSENQEAFNHLKKVSSPFSDEDFKISVSQRGCTVTLPIYEAERIYGFGLQLKSFMQNGKKKIIRTNADPSSDSGDSHAPIPFYVSTLGYGILVDTARYVSFYCGSSAAKEQKTRESELGPKGTTEALYKTVQSSSSMVIDIPVAQGIDIYIFAGTDMKDAICRYNLFSGGGCLPPLKGLGVLYRGYVDANQNGILDISKALRDDHIPCDIIGLEPGWHSKAYSCSYLWNDIKFPVPEDMIQALKDRNFDINLWEQAFVNPLAPFYNEIKDHSGDYLVWEGLVPDFTILQAREAFAKHHEKLVDLGITGFKLDECDSSDYTGGWSFPNCTQFPSGLDGEQMHNQMGIFFQDTQYELYKKKNKRTYSQVRASHALASSYPFVLYSDLYNHRDFFRALLNAGFSGLLWTPEVRQTDSAIELIRRIQIVCLSAQVCINSWMIPNLPWRQFHYEENLRGELLPESQRIALTLACKKALEFRMSLIPYLYSAFWKYKTTGTPVFRALVMDYPNDIYAQEVEDQVLIGDSLMAAPMFADEGNKRNIYLPEGVWFDFETGTRLIGGQWLKDVEVPIDHIPIFVKGNSIIPIANPVEWINENTQFNLTINIYGSDISSFALYEDDGYSFNFEKGMYNITELQYNHNRLNLDAGFSSPMKKYIIDQIILKGE